MSKTLPDQPLHRTPIILAIDGQEWTLRSYESVIGPRGYAVTRAYTGRQGLTLVKAIRPDAVLVGARLPDMGVVAFLEALRSSTPAAATLPVIVTSSGPEASPHRVEFLQAGAWAVLSPATDPEAFVAQLDVLTRAKMEIDRVRESALIDDATGFYSLVGLARRARELAADAYRRSAPLACVVVGTVPDAEGQADDAAVEELASALRRVSRNSDVIGRVSARQFAIVAAADLSTGIDAVLARVHAALADADRPGKGAFDLTVGVAHVPNYRESALPVDDLLHRASQHVQRRSTATATLLS